MDRVLDDVVALDPDRIALIIGGERTSYAELERAIADAAAGLAERAGAQVQRIDGGPYLDLGLGTSRYGVLAAPERHFAELRRLVG